MVINNFDEFYKKLLLNLVNHRYGEDAVDEMPFYTIDKQNTAIINIEKVKDTFGDGAIAHLKKFIGTELRPHRLTRCFIQPGHGYKLYRWFKERNMLHLLRTDKEDGWLDPWIVVQTELSARRP